MAEPARLELAISGVTGRRVNQLHHGSMHELLYMEPGKRQGFRWIFLWKGEWECDNSLK